VCMAQGMCLHMMLRHLGLGPAWGDRVIRVHSLGQVCTALSIRHVSCSENVGKTSAPEWPITCLLRE
jgi:hypothetical protein